MKTSVRIRSELPFDGAADDWTLEEKENLEERPLENEEGRARRLSR